MRSRASSRRKAKMARRRTLFLIILITISVSCYYFIFASNKLYKTITIEAGAKTITPSQFIKNEKFSGIFVTDLSAINMNKPGVYDIEIKIGNRVYRSKLKVEDTKAPKATAVAQEVWINEKLPAESFVKDINDCTKVKVSYKEEPDFSKAGDKKIVIVLEDEGGNKTELNADLKVKADTEAPVIKGAADRTVFIGDKILYKKDVTVTDNRDKDIELEIDSSAVNVKKEGSYKVIYKAADSSGNTAEKTVTFTVKVKPKDYVSQETLDALADQVLNNILKDGMTKKEKARAIYDWTRGHISYVDYSDKSDWVKAAYQGIKNGSGDCFNYFATAKELLTRAGIQNMEIIKLGGGHYWSLVNLGTGWYHYDTTPRRSGGEFFMLTDAQITAYSKAHGNSHVWDKSKYPATPLVIFK